MTTKPNDHHPLAVLVSNCRHLLHTIMQHKISKILRSGNQCTDAMARFARNLESKQRTFVEAPAFAISTYLQELDANYL